MLLLDNEIDTEIPRKFLLGLRSSSLSTVDDPEISQRKIEIACDDGSRGFKGNVVELLETGITELKEHNTVVYGCGPKPMITALTELCKRHSIPLFVSLEVPMGCGLGACQSCAVPRADGKGYYLVCQDGPVFRAEDVNLSSEVLP